nr:CPBP family glutamic-type intramembrane protease [uncultured Pseudokineococcus sp.]
MLGGLRRRWHPAAAVVVSAALFAAIHGVLVVMPYLAVLGVGLAVLREVHRTLWAPVIAHAANNALASLSVLVVLTG